ncbi:MAG TPA: spermidine/putrescine ABC transporter permease PotC, partial [Spirochaetaceae bacterium]|nr:spermidine/putrescine ABC transporter permease PotC [Spirochaetaceae bacterium]
MKRRSSFSRAVFIGTIVFLFMPLFVLVLYSFNESKSGSWTGFSLRWYIKLFSDSPDLWRA